MTTGCNTFEGIWRRYYKNTHSNTWLYMTDDWQGYFMDKKEFSKLVHQFASVVHESHSRGYGLKIRCHKQSKKLVAWLDAQCA